MKLFKIVLFVNGLSAFSFSKQKQTNMGKLAKTSWFSHDVYGIKKDKNGDFSYSDSFDIIQNTIYFGF